MNIAHRGESLYHKLRHYVFHIYDNYESLHEEYRNISEGFDEEFWRSGVTSFVCLRQHKRKMEDAFLKHKQNQSAGDILNSFAHRDDSVSRSRSVRGDSRRATREVPTENP